MNEPAVEGHTVHVQPLPIECGRTGTLATFYTTGLGDPPRIAVRLRITERDLARIIVQRQLFDDDPWMDYTDVLEPHGGMPFVSNVGQDALNAGSELVFDISPGPCHAIRVQAEARNGTATVQLSARW